MEETKKEFNAFLDSTPQPHDIAGYPVRKLLDFVMYGSGLIHYAKTDRQTKQDFKDVLGKHQREWVIFTFICYCQQLYDYANRLYFVLRQDHEHWIANEGCSPPDLVFMRGLFESHRLVPETVDAVGRPVATQ